MRNLSGAICFLAIFILIACQPVEVEETGAKMEGEPARIRIMGYEDMCEREPESVLCKEEGDE